LDPDLGDWTGPQYLRDGKPNFGVFLDSSPDRWGRELLGRREALLAKAEKRPERTLQESDYLLGVFDGSRMGALRFRTAPDGPFLDNNAALAAPPMAQLAELEEASLRIEEGSVANKWLQMLVAPGSSLGGSRPKANVQDAEGQLWIAKFPSKNDSLDQGAWELVVARLAQASGIEMSECRAQKLSALGHTFLTRRFDRAGRTLFHGGRRVHIASAMTLLAKSDGEEASWLELAELVMRESACAEADLEQLWRRLVFHIAVSNTDGHLRNHAFVLTPGKGWRLAPAYDLNPEPTARGLALNISETSNALDFELALSVAPYFRLDEARAQKILNEVKTTVQNWEAVARKLRIPKNERDRMCGCFKCK
jgi:serine/threonine-protein kinase HipA